MKFIRSIFLVASLLCVCANFLQAAQNDKKQLKADYVIVGVGTAGAVLAKRLTDKDVDASVIALHIGPNLTDDPIIKFTRFAGLTVVDGLIGPPFYQNGLTIPQPNDDFRQLIWALALPAGGASSVNAGAYCIGTRELYNQWQAIAGSNWAADRVLGLYKKLEKYTGDTNCPQSRGFSGPLDVRQVQDPTPIALKFTNAVEAIGFPFVLDYNCWDTPIGTSSQLQYTMKGVNGQIRVSSVTAFLNEQVMKPNGHGVNGRKLRVLFESTGLRTLWNGNKAIGVEYLHNGKVKQVRAKKGVVVCCGLKSSPFLMYSGVGPRDVLES